MDFHEDIRKRLKSIRESILKEKSTVGIEEKDKVKDNGKKRRKKKRRKWIYENAIWKIR